MKTYLLAITVLITQVLFAQIKTDWEKMHLKGKVKQIELGSYELDGSDTLLGTNKIYHFNKKGFIDSLEVLGAISPNSYSKTIYLYKGNSILANTVKSISEDGQFANYEISDWRRRKMFYNSSGSLVKIKEINRDTVLTREIKYKYDEQGRIKKINDNDLDYSNIATKTWTYNSNGSRSMRTTTRPDGRIVRYYDNDGLEVKSQMSYPKNNKEYTEEKYSWTNDKKGNWIRRHTASREVSPKNEEVIWDKSTGTYRTITYYE